MDIDNNALNSMHIKIEESSIWRRTPAFKETGGTK